MTLFESSRRLFAPGIIALAVGVGTANGQVGGSTPQVYEPQATPRAVVTIGQARFTVLTPQLIRIEWAADGKFEDHASFAFLNRRLPVPPFESKVVGRGTHRTLTLDTAALHLSYEAGTATAKFSPQNLTIRFNVGPVNGVWHPGDVDTGNLGGTTRTLDRVQGADVKLESGLVSRSGWALVDDSSRPLFDSANFVMSSERSSWPWVMPRPLGDRIDWYFFGYGHEYRKALGDFIQVAGRIPLPPHYAFGNWWSRYWAYSDQELQNLVSGYEQRKIPLDVLVIDMDWHLAFTGGELDQSGHRRGWSGYTWNRNLFPEPERFLSGIHQQGLKVTLNLHPASGVQPFEEAYPAMARAMGQDPAEQKYVPFRITDRKFVDKYFELLHHPLEKQGVDFWWLDWQQEDHTEVAGVNPTFWLNYLHFTDQEREGKRPLIFHRWGGLGNHRYQIGFSGDVISSWDSLAFQPGFTAQAANVGYAYWSHDIGGHIPGNLDAELYTRWIQFGAFSPILRTHTTKNIDAERRVWAYPEPYSDIMADTMRLRYRWLPYIYTEARRTYDTGVAFLRPLYYDSPEQDEAYHSWNEYQFGDQVIAAPVVHPVNVATNLAQENIWLPDGEWIEEPTGLRVRGAARTPRKFFLEEIPLYQRPGTIIPMQSPVLHSVNGSVDPLIIRIMPLDDGQKASYELYEDSGETRNYMTDAFLRTGLHAERAGNVLRVTVEPARGNFPGMKSHRRLEVELPHDWPPVQVAVNGKLLSHTDIPGELGWSYSGNTVTTSIRTDALATDSPSTVVITRNPEWTRNSALLNGFAGKMTSLRHAYEELNGQLSVEDLVIAMQTGNRIRYHPENCLTEVQQLDPLMHSVLEQLKTMEKALQESETSSGSPQPEDPAALERRRLRAQRLSRADAALHRASAQ